MAIALLVGACGGSSEEAAPTPEPTVEIAAAPTATSAPAEEPTATPAPTATPTPEPTAAPDMTVEEEVIAAWERYWDLAVQARGEDPPPEALSLETYVGGVLLESLRETLAEQEPMQYFVVGSAVPSRPRVEVRDEALAIVDGCVAPNLQSIATEDGAVLGSQDEPRLVRGRVENTGEGWRVTAVEIGEEPC